MSTSTPRTRSSLFASRLWLPLLTFAAALAVSFFVTRLLTSGGGDAEPTFDDPVVVVVPVVAIGDPDTFSQALVEDDRVRREAASEAGVAVDAASVMAEPMVGGGGSAAELLEVGEDPLPGADLADRPDDEDVGVSGIPGSPFDPDPDGDRIIDLCAGDSPPFDCPAGVGGIVLFQLDALPPFEGMMSFRPYRLGDAPYPYVPQCDDRDLPAGSVLVGLSANRPADIELVVSTSGGDPVAQYLVSTSPGAESAWATVSAADETTPDDPRLWIQHCFVIDDLEPGIYDGRATFTDRLASGDSFVFPLDGPLLFRVSDEAAAAFAQVRRPTLVIPVAHDRVFVNATRQFNQYVSVRAVPSSRTCSVSGPGDLRYERGDAPGALVGSEAIPPERLRAADYPYLPNHGYSDTVEFQLVEGTDYLLCLAWVQGDGPSFSPDQIVLTEEIAIGTPEAYRVRVQVLGIDDAFGLNGTDVESGYVQVFETLANCVVMAVRFEREGQEWSHDGELCPSMSLTTNMVRRGITVVTELDTLVGRRAGTTRVRVDPRCSSHPCPPRPSEIALVPLPEIPTERRLCGSGFGGGCSGDVPTRSAGTIRLRLDFLVGEGGNGLRSFYVGEPRPFGTSEELPIDPPLDVSVQTLPTPWRTALRDGVQAQVRVVSDRPVTFTAEVVAPDGGAPCAVVPRDAEVRAVPATSHFFHLFGLCSGADYRIVFTGSDAEGNPVGVVTRPGATPVPHHDFTTTMLEVPVTARITANPETVSVARSFTAYAQVWIVSPGRPGIPAQHVDYEVSDALRTASARYGWTFDESGTSACGRPRNRVDFVKEFDGSVNIASPEHLIIQATITFRENEELFDGRTGDDRYTCLPWNRYRYQLVDDWTLQRSVTLEELSRGVTIVSGARSSGASAQVTIRAGD